MRPIEGVELVTVEAGAPSGAELRLGQGVVRVFYTGCGRWEGRAHWNRKELAVLAFYETKAEAVEAGWNWLRDERRAHVYTGWSWGALVLVFLGSAAIFQGALPWWGIFPWLAAWFGAPLVAQAVARRRGAAYGMRENP